MEVEVSRQRAGRLIVASCPRYLPTSSGLSGMMGLGVSRNVTVDRFTFNVTRHRT